MVSSNPQIDADYVDADEDYILDQVESYINLANRISIRPGVNLGYIDRALKVIMMAGIIQNEKINGTGKA